MTRSEFLENITNLTDLIHFCWAGDCDICEDLYDDDAYDEQVDEDICDAGYGWRALRDYLADLPTGYSWYRRDGTFDYVGIDEDGYEFEDYKNSVMEWMDEGDYWETDEDDETPVWDPEDDDGMSAREPEEDDSFSVEPEDPDDFEVFDVDFVQMFMEAGNASVAVASDRIEEGDDISVVHAGIADCLSKIS